MADPKDTGWVIKVSRPRILNAQLPATPSPKTYSREALLAEQMVNAYGVVDGFDRTAVHSLLKVARNDSTV